jgi:crossover junction endodeoxyribonuclease RuvC
MRILGIDPGSHVMGWGLVCVQGSRVVCEGCGAWKSLPEEPLPERLKSLGQYMDGVLRDHQPQSVAVESVFHAQNSKSALVLGHARGVVLYCAALHGALVHEYAPTVVKQSVTGYGKADKNQVQQMVKMLLRIEAPLLLDTSDALAVALCHAVRVQGVWGVR